MGGGRSWVRADLSDPSGSEVRRRRSRASSTRRPIGERERGIGGSAARIPLRGKGAVYRRPERVGRERDRSRFVVRSLGEGITHAHSGIRGATGAVGSARSRSGDGRRAIGGGRRAVGIRTGPAGFAPHLRAPLVI